jgi:CHAD domain-containing protein
MSFRFKLRHPVEKNVQRVANEQIEKAIQEAGSGHLTVNQKVHQLRKCCKKIRGLLRLVRPEIGNTYKEENKWYRDLARSLSKLRDQASSISAFDKLIKHYSNQIDSSTYSSIRQRLEGTQEKQFSNDETITKALEEAKASFLLGRDRISKWTIDASGYKAVKKGFCITFSRSCDALETADDLRNSESMHEYRKCVKDHWYHCRLLQSVWPAIVKARRNELKKLSELLGNAHDLSVLEQSITKDPDPFGDGADLEVFLTLLRQRGERLCSEAISLGKKLFAEDVSGFSRRFGIYWKVSNQRHSRNLART